MTTMVDWRESKLNPDAPVFDPVGFREVEDFSPRWWELVTTSKWFRDFWLTVNSDYEFDGGDLTDMEDFEELIVSSEEDKNGGFTDDTVIESDVGRYLSAILKLLTMMESMKGKVQNSKVAINTCSPKYNQKKTSNKYINPNFSCRRNHQIYQPRTTVRR